MLPIETVRSTVAKGVRIHWDSAGAPSTLTPVVLLHGLNDSHLTWNAVAADLSRDRLVILPDLPGHGMSERPDVDYTLDWYADVMADWMAEAGLECADLVGHSFGGGVAQMMLLKCRQRIRRLALVSSGGLGSEIALGLRLASRAPLIERLGQPFMAMGSRFALRSSGGGRQTLQDAAALGRMNAQSGSARAFARTVRDLIGWRGQRYLYEDRIREVRQLPPMRIFWGARDWVIPASHGKRLAKACEGVELVLFKRSGHYLHYEVPTLFARLLRNFLDEPGLPGARMRDGTTA